MSERHDLRDRLVMPILLPVGALLFIFGLVFGLSRILLAVTPTGAVIVAIVTAAAVLGLAGLLSSVPKVRAGQALAMVLGIAGIALITGGVVAASLVETPEEGGGGEGPPAVAIAAPAGAAVDGFAQTEVSAPAGVPFVIEFDNADPSVQHNVAIYPEGGTGTALFSGQIVTGPTQASYDAPALDAGAYTFLCEVHPTTMTGTLTAAEGGGGGGGETLVAKDLAFNTNELHLPAGQEVSLEFDNQDNAVPHNFAIYTEEGGDPIFQGEQITGPAKTTYTFTIPDPGEFYFHCDVHPQMSGTVIAGEGGGGG